MTADEVVWTTDDAERFLPGADLAGDSDGHVRGLLEAPERPVYLAGADLSGADLSGVNLLGVVLCGANLSEADLSNARVEGEVSRWPAVNLSGADLRGADFSGAALRSVSFRAAVLTGVNWTGASVHWGTTPSLDDCDFRRSTHDFPSFAEWLAQSEDELAARVVLALNPVRVLTLDGDPIERSDHLERSHIFVPPGSLTGLL